MSQTPRALRVVRRMATVTEWEEFEFEVVGEDLAARHSMKLGAGSAFEACLRALPSSRGVFESRLGSRIGRDPHELTAGPVRTPEELADMRSALAA